MTNSSQLPLKTRNRRPVPLILLLVLIWIQASPPPAAAGQFPLDFLAEERRDMELRVDAYLEPLLEQDLISGAVLIARGGDILLAKGYGPANREYGIMNSPVTKFRLGSITKQFTAMAILILQHQGKLNVEDAIRLYLPKYPNGDRITIHHLLTHTSGIPNYNTLPDYSEKLLFRWTPEQVIHWFKDEPLRFEPGARFEYSNSGYILLTAIIEKVSEKPYADFLREAIFEPLGMENTGQDEAMRILRNRAIGHFNPDGQVYQALYRDMPFTSGAGSLYSTVMDLYLWDRALYTDALIPESLRQLMFTPHAEGYAYGWFIEDRFGRRLVNHGGAINGFLTDIQRYVDYEVLVIALFNYESTFAKNAFRGLGAIALEEPYEPLLEGRSVEISYEKLGAYAGIYQLSPEFPFMILVEEGTLLVEGPDRKQYAGIPQTVSKFFFKGMNAMLTFFEDEGGEVNRLTLRNGVHRFPCRRIEPEDLPDGRLSGEITPQDTNPE